MIKRGLRVGVVRLASVANEIAAALGVDPAPEVVISRRIKITFRSIGASRWPEQQQVDYALQIAAVARRILTGDNRRRVRRRVAESAIVVAFEDATVRRGCSIVGRWEIVSPVTASLSPRQSPNLLET